MKQLSVIRTTTFRSLFTGSLLLTILTTGGTATAQPATDSDSDDQASVKADSLRAAITSLRKEARQLREEAERIYDSLETMEDASARKEKKSKGFHLEVKLFDTPSSEKRHDGPKDTVELLSPETTRAFLDKIKGKKRGGRERGYGGGLGPAPSAYAINIDPVQELLDYMSDNSDLRNVRFPIHGTFKSFFMMGITGYGAVGNGLRIGGSFVGGERNYTAHKNDTLYNLKIETSFGGLLLEKAFIFDKYNLYLGGIAGGASFDVQPSKTLDFLSTSPVNIDESSYNKLSAPAVLLELHTGGTYTMINWFHVGMDLSLPLFFSTSGFQTPAGHSITNGFLTINPGVRFRIIFGNIG